MYSKFSILALTAILFQAVSGFAPGVHHATASSGIATKETVASSSTSLQMANDDDLLRWARSSRDAGANDNVVSLVRPIGVILSEDDKGNVFVETLAPNGNAARSGQVKEGDIVTMCSATFGNDMWSCRGVGLTRVLAAIRVRAGATVSLVFESPNAYMKKAATTTKQKQAMQDARVAAQAKKDSLLKELERDEKKLKKGKFLGLF